jgi:hypothetical protein
MIAQKTPTLQRLNGTQLEEMKGIAPKRKKKNRVPSSTATKTKKPISAEGSPVSPPVKQAIDPKKTKTAYTTWANDHRLLKKGGRTYTIPADTPFLKIQEKCPFGQGYAEVTFSRKVALNFYPYKELPMAGETLKVVIPHEFLNINPRKGSWKGERL